MRRSAVPACALALAACTAPGVVDRALAPGDVVIVAGADTAHLLRADADGTVDLALGPGAWAALAVVRAADVIDARGAPVSLDGLTVALDQPRGICGCTAPALTLPWVVAPGDHCPLPAAIPLDGIDARGDPHDPPAELRARLSLRWAGDCACRPAPLVDASQVTACPIGEDAARLSPDRVSIASDGEVVMVGRSHVVRLAPDGHRDEIELVPGVEPITGLHTFAGGGALIAARLTIPFTIDRAELVWVPPRDGGAPRRLRGAPQGLAITGIAPATGPRDLWLHGSVFDHIARRPSVVRCRFGDLEAECSEAGFPNDPACPHYRELRDVDGGGELDDGDFVGAVRGPRLVFVHRGRGVCMPGSDAAIALPSGRPQPSLEVGPMAVIGRRLVGCFFTFDENLVVVATATVGPVEQGRRLDLRWETLVESRLGERCISAHVDEAGRAVIGYGGYEGALTFLTYSSSTATARVAPVPAALGPIARQASGSAFGSAIISGRGELWQRRVGERAFARTLAVPAATLDGDVRAILPVEGGYRAYLGATAPLSITAPDSAGCSAIALGASVARAHPDDRDEAVVRLADQVLVFTQRGGSRAISVRDLDDRELRRLPLDGDAEVVRAVEVSPRAWAAFLRRDGTLWATDGAVVRPLSSADEAWLVLDAADGVGWVAGVEQLGRILATGDGALRLEPELWPAVDRAAFTALEHLTVPRPAGLRALCGGRVMITFDEVLGMTAPDVVDTVSVWTIELRGERLTMVRYRPLLDNSSRPFLGDRAVAVLGPEEAPVLVFAGGPWAAGLHGPGAAAAALPFREVRGFAQGRSDALVGGAYGRVSLVHVERTPP